MIVVGLGNPGNVYEKTRHNAGFMAIEHFAKEHEFPDFKSSSKYQSSVSERKFHGRKIILAKPETYMNSSGKAVKALLESLLGSLTSKKNLEVKLPTIVIHDDIDIPLGKIKVSEGSGSAGHKGVESIMQELGNKDFIRIRIGIQPQEGKPPNVEEFVLQKFSPQELPLLQQSFATISNWLLGLAKQQKI